MVYIIFCLLCCVIFGYIGCQIAKEENNTRLKKKRILKEMCALAENNSIIKSITIFENDISDSSIEYDNLCVCLELDGSTRDIRLYDIRVQINKICDYDCDILIKNQMGSKMRKVIVEKGIVIYEKQS